MRSSNLCDPSSFCLYQTLLQRAGNRLDDGESVLKAAQKEGVTLLDGDCLDLLLQTPDLIPHDWRLKRVYFLGNPRLHSDARKRKYSHWNTIYQLTFENGQWQKKGVAQSTLMQGDDFAAAQAT